MFHLVFFEPEIAPNTGNVIRLCANTGVHFHLIKPLGFELDDKKLRRAGLDYDEYAQLQVHESWQNFLRDQNPQRIFAFTTKGHKNHTNPKYRPGDVLLFGPETRGLPSEILNSLPDTNLLRIPMLPTSRSLNLSNTAAIAVFEAWRQQGFIGGR